MTPGKIVAISGVCLCIVLAVLLAAGVLAAVPPVVTVALIGGAFAAVALS